MNLDKVLKEMDVETALFGLFLAFGNKLQTIGDRFYEEITCKQFFMLICLSLFQDESPTIKELAEVMGSTHQNVKQIVDKLEKNGFVKTCQDKEDKRKIRIKTTPGIQEFSIRYQNKEQLFLEKLYKNIPREDLKKVLAVLLQLEENIKNFEEETE